MRISLYARVKIVIDVHGDFSKRLIPSGTEGVVVDCHGEPDFYPIDVAFPSEDFVGGFEYDNVTLTIEQFEVIDNTPYP
jgi:hypothetical protein